MCSTCGCGQPLNKHKEKTIQTANRKYADLRLKFEAIKSKVQKK